MNINLMRRAFEVETSMGHDGSRQDEENSALADALDAYLTAMQVGDHSTCQKLLAAHPELAEFADQLDVLDRLSPDANYSSTIWDSALAQEDFGEPSDGMELTLTLNPSATAGTANQSPLPPTGGPRGQFGRYLLLEELGRGGMGVVYRARQLDLERIVALKMILANRLAAPDQVRRFYQEAKAAGRLSHPHIVAIHEVGEVHGQHFFSMDCIEGPSLSDLLKGGPAFKHDSHVSKPGASWSGNQDGTQRVSESRPVESAASENGPPRMSFEDAARIVRDVSRAADYLHSQNIIHRDIKPSNVLLSKTGSPHLTDFGLAKCQMGEVSDTNSGAIVGTPLYMSPEQAAGRNAEVGPQSDVYSLGAVLYQALTGRPPHQGPNPMRVLVAVMEDEPQTPRNLNPDAPRELEAICLKCLEKNPQNRYASASALAEDLDRYLRGEPVLAETSSWAHRIRRWMRREPALASRWGALILGGIIVHLAHLNGDVGELMHGRLGWLFFCWAVSAFIFQRLVQLYEGPNVARYLWLATDAALLTRLLFISGHPVGPLVVVYPLLIAASGLFFEEGLVYFMTSVSLISYATLLWLVPEEADPGHYCLSFAAVLVVIGFVTAHQVHRIRTLSRLNQ